MGKCGTSKIKEGIPGNGMFEMWLETGFSRKVLACLSSVGKGFGVLLLLQLQELWEAGRQPPAPSSDAHGTCRFRILTRELFRHKHQVVVYDIT